MTDDRKGVGHTAGPWETKKSECGNFLWIYPRGQLNWNVAHTNYVRGKDSCEANARLIAAAPDYYAGVEAFIAYEAAMESGDDVSAVTAYAQAADLLKAAHARATGATP